MFDQIKVDPETKEKTTKCIPIAGEESFRGTCCQKKALTQSKTNAVKAFPNQGVFDDF